MDRSKLDANYEEGLYLQQHMIAALISLFALSEKDEILGAISAFDLEQTNRSLQSGMAVRFGIIREMTDGKP